MNIYIMTRGRIGRLETPKWIPRRWMERTYIVCPPHEMAAHEEHWPHANVLPAFNINNYSEKFQFLLQYIYDNHGRGVIVDDDLTFARRPDDGAKRLIAVQPEELSGMWHQIDVHLDDCALVSVHPRMMGHDKPLPYVENGKIVTLQAVNTWLFPGDFVPKVDWDPILADVHLNCHLLSHGVGNRIITTHVLNWGPSQALGGCDYRTPEMQETAVKRIEEMYAPYAKAVWKKNKAANWLGEDGRWDLRVQWKKLFEAAPHRDFGQ